MWVADMDFRCPECVQEALREQMSYGAYGYNALHTRFMKAFAQWEQTRHGCGVSLDHLRYAPGVVPAVNWCVETMTQPGDSIMTLPPVYYPFFAAVTANDRKLVLSPLRREGERYEMDFADMEEKMISDHVRMLIFCSPHNPVGRVWTREELEKLVQLCRKHNVTIVSDEIHQDFVFAPAKHIPLMTLEPNAVTLIAPSKTFNLAGMQTAVAIIPEDSLREKWDVFTKRLHLNSGSTFGYLAGEAACLHGEAWLEELKEFFTKKCRIALDYGTWFKGDGETFARFNLATSRENVEKAAESVISALK